MSKENSSLHPYDILADNYSAIFPLEQARVNFIKSALNRPTGKILDIGCATGDLACALARLGYQMTGVDLNAKMLQLAAAQAKREDLPVIWQHADMLHFMRTTDELFDAILCFGNTLPHLATLSDVEEFFRLARQRLLPTGILLIQILNYDKILAEQQAAFPKIETENLRFERDYDFGKELIFHIRLWDKTTSQSFEDSTRLLPVRKKQLTDAALAAGFKQVNTYANYQSEQSNGTEWATLYLIQ